MPTLAATVLDFSGPLLALGFYDTQAAHLDLAGNECVLNGVAGTPHGISSISESGTTVTVATAGPHGLSSGGNIGIAQLHSPLRCGCIRQLELRADHSHRFHSFHLSAATTGLPRDINDGVVGRACRGGQGFIGDVARNARLDLYLNYFLGTDATGGHHPTWQRLQAEANGGILRIDSVNDAFYPWKGYDPELTGNVLSADPAQDRLLLHLQIERESPMRRRDRSDEQLDLERRRILRTKQLEARPSSLLPWQLCARQVFFDDLDHRLGGDGSDPPGLGSASTSVRTEDPSFFGMYVHDEPTIEFLPKAQNLMQYIRTYSRSTATFGAFIFGFGANTEPTFRLARRR